jgi:hypothetical protein
MDKMFMAALRSQTLGAGQKLKFTATWEGAPAGRYNVTGTLTRMRGRRRAVSR